MNIEELINNKDILNIFRFGSVVYKSNDEESNENFICIISDHFNIELIKNNFIKYYKKQDFIHHLNNHDIQILECLYLSQEHILKETIKIKEIPFELNISKLKKSISIESNLAWGNGKNKLTVDFNLREGLKSIYHSIRILSFGIQIIFDSYIRDYESNNNILSELYEISKKYSKNELWEIIERKYKSKYFLLNTLFEELCFKILYNSSENDEKYLELKKILKHYEIENDKLCETIYRVFIK